MSVEIRGAEQLVRLSKALKLAGDKDLQRELSKGISQAMKPVMAAVRQSARDILPNRGGLNQKVAKTSMRTIRRAGVRSAGIKLQANSAYHLGQLNRGILHHPVWGNRNVWVMQRVAAGWWDKPTEAAAPEVRAELEQAMRRVARQIDRAV